MGATFLIIIFTSLFAGPPGHAGQEAPEVLYFGGHLASGDHMRRWEARSRAGRYGKEFNFTAFGFPSSEWKAEEVLPDAQPLISRVVSYIKANPHMKFVLAGHSSGVFLTLAIVRKLPRSAMVNLVAIDGDTPPADIQARIPTFCWAGKYKMEGCSNRRMLGPTRCQTEYCRHFRLVNNNAPVDLDLSTYGTKGYDSLDPFLEWLDDVTFPGDRPDEELMVHGPSAPAAGAGSASR